MIRIFILTLFISPQLFASGTMTLEGSVKGFSPDYVQIFDGHDVYTISKKKLNAAELAKLKQIKVGTKVTLQTPFEAVESVKK